MNIKASYTRYNLIFKRPSGTSRGILKEKETWFLLLKDEERWGIGECAVFRGLSADDVENYEEKLQWVCQHIHLGLEELLKELQAFPSIQFGLEQAFLSLSSVNPFILFPSSFTENKEPIAINGLVWMGEQAFMHKQIEEKIAQGFSCIKLKIGAIDFNKEMALLEGIRAKYNKETIEIRVDANGAFSPDEALDKLRVLASFQLHSIEQPIKQRQLQQMKELCLQTPLPIALDEELIGIHAFEEKEALLKKVAPQYIILKPSLVGGFKESLEWITLAEKYNIGWWITSALESNIGLNAIAQWTKSLQVTMPQGLGTGNLFTNNINSPLEVIEGSIRYNKNKDWDHKQVQLLCI